MRRDTDDLAHFHLAQIARDCARAVRGAADLRPSVAFHVAARCVPRFAPPKVEIQTEAPGLSTEEVESLITVPLENALNGTPGSRRSARSRCSACRRSCCFRGRNGPERGPAVRAGARRRRGAAPADVARPPVILQPLSSLSRVMKIGIWSEKLSQRDLTDLAVWTIRPQLMAIPGVANVAIWGQRDKQFQVLVDPDRLRPTTSRWTK